MRTFVDGSRRDSTGEGGENNEVKEGRGCKEFHDQEDRQLQEETLGLKKREERQEERNAISSRKLISLASGRKEERQSKSGRRGREGGKEVYSERKLTFIDPRKMKNFRKKKRVKTGDGSNA